MCQNPDETRIDGTEAKQTALTLKFGKIVANEHCLYQNFEILYKKTNKAYYNTLKIKAVSTELSSVDKFRWLSGPRV